MMYIYLPLSPQAFQSRPLFAKSTNYEERKEYLERNSAIELKKRRQRMGIGRAQEEQVIREKGVAFFFFETRRKNWWWYWFDVLCNV